MSLKRTLKTLSIDEKFKLIKEVETGSRKKDCESGSSKRLKNPTFANVDRAVSEWFKSARRQNLPISGGLIKEKALEFGQKLGQPNFKASTGWLDNWKRRWGICHRKVCGESADVSDEDCVKWKHDVLPHLLEDYQARDVFNADETVLFFKCLPDNTLTFKNQKCLGGKHSKQRVTLMIGANMDGSEKLLLIGKSNQPLAAFVVSILYCSIHCPNGLENRGWGETEMSQLPNILMPLKIFSEKVNDLLSSHMGTLPLLSFPICYKVEYSEALSIDENGVSLEHLVTCVKNVELKFGGPNHNIKYIKREIKTNTADILKEDSLLKSSSTSILSNIQLLCREMVDLLKTTERCQLPLGRLIPAYHHHFGRQCRVADYGFTKLIDLLESNVVSSVVQILGYGTKRIVTLTHPTQMRRFTSDLLRVLKGQVPRQLTATEFPNAYEKIVGRPFNAIEYGLCSLEDLLDEVPDNTVVITKRNGVIGIAIPKREQTAEEIMRTRQFADEAVKLLSYSPECSMFFNKFVPAYHHHFGHQCKVSDYGFTKLIELFEAIPDTVYIEETTDGDRKVCLTLPRALKVLGEQIVNIIRHSKLASLPLESLPSTYLREYGYTLKPQSYDCHDYHELISKLSDFVQVTQSRVGPLLILAHTESNFTLSMRIWTLLLESPHCMSVPAIINQYRIRFQSNISESKLEQLTDVIKVTSPEGTVSLTPFYILAAQLYSVLYRSGGQVGYSNLENLYKRHYNKDISYSILNIKSLEDLISKLNFMLLIRGSRKKTSIILSQNLAEYGVPLPFANSDDSQNQKKDESSMQWPPPPAHDLLLTPKSYKKITPPKPDSPPTPGSAVWANWHSPCKFNNSVDLSIPIPTVNTLKLVRNFDALISPTKNLLPAHSYQLSSVLSTITPPHPTEVPMPDKLLGKDDSNDSGVVSNSNIASENEMDVSSEQTGAKPKQGSNLSKLFSTYNM